MLFSPSFLKKETLWKVAHLLILFAYSFWALRVATESIGEFLFIGKGGYVLKCGQKITWSYFMSYSLLFILFLFILLDQMAIRFFHALKFFRTGEKLLGANR